MRKAVSMYTTMQQDGAKKFLAAIGRNSASSKTSYAVALTHFQKFLDSKQYTLASIIKPLKAKSIDVYELLDEFLTYILEQKNGNDETTTISPKTIKAYLAGIKSYFTWMDIDIVPAKFKQRVKMPKTFREDEEAIDASDIREILLHTNNRRLKPYLLILASGAPRANEGTSLRIMDIDFTVSPTMIYIRNTKQHHTKTRAARYTFISDEATKFLKEWIAWKYRSKESVKDTDLVFGSREIIGYEGVYSKLRQEFNKILALVNKAGRKDGQQRRKITLNSFGRFAKTVVSDQVSTDYSEWFIGHAKSSYWTKKEPEKRKIYATKCMKYLTFLDYSTLETTGKNIEARISEKENEIQLLRQRDQIKDQELQSMKEHIQAIEQSQRQSFEEFKVENHRIMKEAMANFKATLSPKALERFSRKPIIEVLEE